MACLSPYKVPQINDGRFLQWTAINYFLDTQTDPIELCTPSLDPCLFYFQDETEVYPLPIQSGDTVKWIMNQNEITVDSGSIIADIKIGIVQEGVLIVADAGTVVAEGDQYFCTATIPCLPEGCDYQFVIYDDSIEPNIICGIYAGAILQDLIDDNIILGQVLECTLNDFL